MTVSLLHVLLYLVGTGALLISYLAFSPVTRDLVVFLSRNAQISIFRNRRVYWAIGIVCHTVLLVSVTYRAFSGLGSQAWLWVEMATLAGLGLAYWATYVPVVMSPPKVHRTLAAAEADKLLRPDSIVLGLVMGDAVRAYPRDLIARPHWFNDMIGDTPLMISYCILCNSGQAFIPVLKDGRRLDLRNMTAYDNNTVYHDVNTDNYIQQLEGKVIAGPNAGEQLQSFPVVMARWADWKALHPDTTVYYAPPMTLRDRVVQKMLETMIPIQKLAARKRPWHLMRKPIDRRLPAMSFVFGTELNGDACAYPKSVLASERVVNDEVGGIPIVVLYDPERDMGQIFSRRLDGKLLTFARPPSTTAKALAQDQETGSLWSVSGEAVEGPLTGRRLETVFHYNQLFWFSWAAFRPHTRIYEGARAVVSPNIKAA